MKWWLAIPFTLLLLCLTSFVSQWAGAWLVWAMVLATAAWAAFDSSKLRAHEYKSGVALKAPALFLGIALLWILGFPWYLIFRERVKSGRAIRKADAVIGGTIRSPEV